MKTSKGKNIVGKPTCNQRETNKVHCRERSNKVTTKPSLLKVDQTTDSQPSKQDQGCSLSFYRFTYKNLFGPGFLFSSSWPDLNCEQWFCAWWIYNTKQSRIIIMNLQTIQYLFHVAFLDLYCMNSSKTLFSVKSSNLSHLSETKNASSRSSQRLGWQPANFTDLTWVWCLIVSNKWQSAND